MNLKNTVISSYKLYTFTKAKFPKREVIASPYVDHDHFYWYGNHGYVRRATVEGDKITEVGTGFGPLNSRKRVRKLK